MDILQKQETAKALAVYFTYLIYDHVLGRGNSAIDWRFGFSAPTFGFADKQIF
jgi:hypothetical protein